MKSKHLLKIQAAVGMVVLILLYTNCSGMNAIAPLEAAQIIDPNSSANQVYVPSETFKVVDDFKGVPSPAGGRGRDLVFDSAGNIYSIGSPWRVRKWNKATGKNETLENFTLTAGLHSSNATDIAIDSTGNIFVSGNTRDASGVYHSLLRMFNPATGLWKTVDDYFTPAVNTDGSSYNALAIDTDGNVYIGGSITTQLTATTRQTTWSMRKWSKTSGTSTPLPLSTGIVGLANAVTIDKSGYIIFAGTGYDPDVFFKYQFFAVKIFNPLNGTWQNDNYSPLAGSNSEALAVTSDPEGNIFAVGNSISSGYTKSPIIRKREALTGLWSNLDATFDGLNTLTSAHAVTSTLAGEIFVFGAGCRNCQSYTKTFGEIVRKFSQSNQLWTTIEAFTFSATFQASTMVFDGSGASAVIGGGESTQILQRWEPAVPAAWTVIDSFRLEYFYGERPAALHADTSGNLWTVGASRNADGSESQIVRRRGVSEPVWRTVDDFKCASNCDQMAMATDASGNFYAAGSSFIQPVDGIFDNTWTVRKWTKSSNSWSTIQKTTRLTFPESFLYHYLTAIAVDSSGNITLSGYATHKVDSSLKQWLTLKWSTQIGWTGPFIFQQAPLEAATPSASVIDETGTLYVVGTSEPSSNIVDRQWTIRKYLGSGDTWETSIDRSETNYKTSGQVHAATTDSQGNIYLAGGCASLNNQPLAWCVRRWNPKTGIWTKLLSEDRLIADQNSEAKSLRFDSAGNLFVAGYAFDKFGVQHWMLKKWDGTNWTIIRNYSTGNHAEAISVTYDPISKAVFTLGLRALMDGNHWTVEQY